MDLYGSQLWNYGTGYPETFYVAWRKVTRLIWKLPFRTHCNLLHTVNNCSPRLAPMWQQSGTLLFCSCHGIAGFLVDELQI